MNLTYNLSNLHSVVLKLDAFMGNRKVLAFHGSMGAGKTTLINALCRHWGVQDAMGSPTFSLINEYASNTGTVYHMDLYRLKHEGEALGAGIEDALYSGHRCLVEWPEKAPRIMPDDALHIYVVVLDDHTRQLKTA